MDSCEAVGKEIDKVSAKFRDVDRHTGRTIQDLLNEISKIRDELRNDVPECDRLGTGPSLLASQSLKRTKESLSKLSATHRDLHGSVSKVGKSIDRNFVSDFTPVIHEHAFVGEERDKQLNSIIGEHFLRQGMLGIAEKLIEDSGLEIDPKTKEPFLELHRILEALNAKDLVPALEWTKLHHAQLQAQHSSLEFKLHRLQFINLLQNGTDSQHELIAYARNLAPFADSHPRELQELMGSLLYLRNGIITSPYAALLDQSQWAEIGDIFTRDACCLLGLSVESPLSVVIRAGCSALPPLLNIKQVMKDRQCPGVWSAKDELPVEIDMGQESRYHSIFACPILRQQSTDSNPPMRLVCGHVISRDALNKLANGNKVKCPYCPVEQSPSDAQCIFF